MTTTTVSGEINTPGYVTAVLRPLERGQWDLGEGVIWRAHVEAPFGRWELELSVNSELNYPSMYTVTEWSRDPATGKVAVVKTAQVFLDDAGGGDLDEIAGAPLFVAPSADLPEPDAEPEFEFEAPEDEPEDE